MESNLAIPGIIRQTHHAILIGVGIAVDRTALNDDGQQVLRDQSLIGTTADIDAIEGYLKEEQHVKVTRLTATKSEGSSEIVCPVEEPSDLSTRENLRKVLKQAKEEGRTGGVEHIYIHFSGHGIRNPYDGTLSLGMYDKSPYGVSYLHGDEIVQELDYLTGIGITVMLVMDCCFSGSVKRTDTDSGEAIRSLEYNPRLEKAVTIDSEMSHTIIRNSTLQADRLLQSPTYTVLTACSLDETTCEIVSGDGSQRGALSYYLVRALWHLRRARTRVTFETLFRHIQTTFHAEHPVQTPMRYGNAQTCFFRDFLSSSYDPYIPVFLHPKSQRLILYAGEAHGVHKGDEYCAYPYFAPDSEGPKEQSQRVRIMVETVYAFRSDVSIVNGSASQRFPREKTWKALPITTVSPVKVRIQLLSSLSNATRDYLFNELASSRYCEPCEQSESSIYTVGVGTDGRYQIQLGRAVDIQQLSSLLEEQDLPVSRVAEVLSHLGAYKFFESIKCHTSSEFESNFSMVLDDNIGPDGWYEVQHGCEWKLKIENKSNCRLYYTVFNFRSSWEIQNVIREIGEDDCDFIDPGSSEELPFIMEVKGTETKEVEDLMKVFIMNRSVSFPGTTLPELGTDILRDSFDRLSVFVDSLKTRFLRDDDETEDSWATQTFMIRTRRDM
ncbi:hypothetical protein NW752_007432 [Fusarium irregulare]|uniref:Peptidase C14 caspase domain-containing protein n=1 Tax=Fusarium irregulare TaxID=2494466 RepID=A0A9W8PMM1_9HYPO|nr:hypothetical protein NW766_007662 [Fusarium irregulare]KAJ4014661.1 hypothetical protein NW752_007432 [Fusarium irregulare]